jgi:hypothetical protein
MIFSAGNPPAMNFSRAKFVGVMYASTALFHVPDHRWNESIVAGRGAGGAGVAVTLVLNALERQRLCRQSSQTLPSR